MANLFPSFNLARMRPACTVKMAKFRSIPDHKIQAAQSIFLIFLSDYRDITQNIQRNVCSDLHSFYFGLSQFHNKPLLIFAPAPRHRPRNTANSRSIQQA
jgi:hypothetical protein